MSVDGEAMLEEYAASVEESGVLAQEEPSAGNEIRQTTEVALSAAVQPLDPSTHDVQMQDVQEQHTRSPTPKSPLTTFSHPFESVDSLARPTTSDAQTVPYPLPDVLTLRDAPLVSADLVSPLNPTFLKQQASSSAIVKQEDSNASPLAGSSRASSAAPQEDLKQSIPTIMANSPRPKLERASASTEGGSSDDGKDDKLLLGASRDQSESSGSGMSTPHSNNDVKPLKRLKKVKLEERPAVLITHLPLAEKAVRMMLPRHEY